MREMKLLEHAILSLVKIDNRQSALHIWKVELLKLNFRNQCKQFRWSHCSINFVKNVSNKENCGLPSL